MNLIVIQRPSIILPAIPDWTAFLGTETEAIDDLVEHTSIEFEVKYLQEKMIHISALEAVGVGVPGNLLCWVELSPYLTTTSADYWAAIGGGGGVFPPTAPHVEVGTGVNGAIHTIILPWAIHSENARVVIQTPVAAALPLAFWVVQAMICGKG